MVLILEILDLGAVSLEPYVARNPSTQKEIEERAIKLKESKENLERNPLIFPNDENEAGPSMGYFKNKKKYLGKF